MNDLLANPAVQAAVAPFIVALVIGLLLRRLGVIAAGLAIIAGLITTVMLTTGLAFQPMTSTRKIILGSLCLPLVVLLLDWVRGRLPGSRGQTTLLTTITIMVPALLLVATVDWVVWPVFMRQEIAEAWPMLARVSLYVGLLGAAFLAMARIKGEQRSTAQATSILALGVGTAVTTMIAASALYAQLAFSVTAAVGALLVIGLFTKALRERNSGLGQLGAFGLFAAATPLLLIGAAATVYAQLSEWVLLCLAIIPLLAWWPPVNVARPWLRLVVTGLIGLMTVIPAIWLAWRTAGPVSF